MKSLKNDCTSYTEQIVSAITKCYKNGEPSNVDLMTLYTFIGECICAQGEKAFVVHLATTLAEQFPTPKGFSPRNLRRMRDFYRTYKDQPVTMQKAQTLGWTQNAVILDCCDTDEQRIYYICLAAEKKLSKLSLVKAIEQGTFESADVEQSADKTVTNTGIAVSDYAEREASYTTEVAKTTCGAFVAACEPSHQGRDASNCRDSENIGVNKTLLVRVSEQRASMLTHSMDKNKKIRPPSVPEKLTGLLRRACEVSSCLQLPRRCDLRTPMLAFSTA